MRPRTRLLLLFLLVNPPLTATSLAPPAPRPPSIPRDPQSSGGTGPFTFPDCVTSCIGDTGCGLNDAHCMCRSAAAPGGILEAVLSCMSFHCRAELHNADANLLAPIQIGCNALNRPIPQAAVQQAEAFANALRQGNAVAGGAGGGGGVSAGAATSTAKSSLVSSSSSSSSSSPSAAMSDARSATTDVATSTEFPTTTSAAPPTRSSGTGSSRSSSTGGRGSDATGTETAEGGRNTNDATPFETPNAASSRAPPSFLTWWTLLSLAVMTGAR